MERLPGSFKPQNLKLLDLVGSKVKKLPESFDTSGIEEVFIDSMDPPKGINARA